MRMTSVGKGGSFRRRKLDCPASDGRRLLYSVGFVVGVLLARNTVHRRPGQSMFHPTKESSDPRWTGSRCKCRNRGGKTLSEMSTVVNGPAGRILKRSVAV